jgi:hypothetical protein
MMGKDKKNLITIDDTEYNIDEMSDQQRTILNHVADLERKLSSARFNLDQLEVGRQAFLNMLKTSLAEKA